MHNASAPAGAMNWRMPGSVTAGWHDRAPSLWFVGMLVISMSGNSGLTTSYMQKPLTYCFHAVKDADAVYACAGAMYWRLPGDVTAGVYDRVASLWFVGMVVIFMSGNSALTISYTQKPLLRREVYAGHYSYLPYYIAKTLTTLPLQLAYAMLYILMTYFLVRSTLCKPHLPVLLALLGHRLASWMEGATGWSAPMLMLWLVYLHSFTCCLLACTRHSVAVVMQS